MKEITSRYAEALYSLKREQNSLLESQKEAKELIKVFKQNPDFMMLLSSSYKDFDEKEEIIDKVFNGLDEDLKTLIKIVTRNHRAQYLDEIFIGFNSLVNEYRGVKEGLVYSTEPLNDTQLQKLNQTVSELEKTPTELKNIIDARLIGGVRVVIHDHVFDGSINYKLETLKNNLKERRTN